MAKQGLEEAGLAQKWEISMHVPAGTSRSGQKRRKEGTCWVEHEPYAQPQLSPSKHVNFPSSKPSFSTNSSACSGTLLLKHFFTPSDQPLKSLYCSTTKVPPTLNYHFLNNCPQYPIPSTSDCHCSS